MIQKPWYSSCSSLCGASSSSHFSYKTSNWPSFGESLPHQSQMLFLPPAHQVPNGAQCFPHYVSMKPQELWNSMHYFLCRSNIKSLVYIYMWQGFFWVGDELCTERIFTSEQWWAWYLLTHASKNIWWPSTAVNSQLSSKGRQGTEGEFLYDQAIITL